MVHLLVHCSHTALSPAGMSAMPNMPQPEWDAAYLDAEGEMMEMPACWGCASPHTTAAPIIKAHLP